MSEIRPCRAFGKLDAVIYSSLESDCLQSCAATWPLSWRHWLHQLMQQQDGDLQQVIRHFALDEQQLTRDIVAALDALAAWREFRV